ncbi:MAG: FlgD immunoglobulin-like domain containing protein, partial [candidate division KSB1 bacterium]|nr:FlgD immunoglobulin-like domain containing protein [candidate division KSB1 bacterium]
QIKAWLLDTAVRDDYTGNQANFVWGAGKMDVYRAMLKAKTGSANLVRELLAYDRKGSNSIVTLTGDIKYAVRFTPGISGQLTGLWISFTTQRHRPIVGQGPLLCEVYTNAAGSSYGVPGQKIGQTVQADFAQLSSGVYNYVNMIPAGVNVTAGSDYHLVLSVANPLDTLIIRTDTAPQVAERSSVFVGGGWHNFGTAPSGIPALNLRVRAEVTGAGQPTSVESEPGIPTTLTLYQNYPNPFNPETAIRFDLPNADHVQLRIYDRLGREVRTLADQTLEAGSHLLRWDGRDNAGRIVASGVYFYELITPAEKLSRKMVLMR